MAQKLCIEFKTDEEHIEHDTNLRDQREVGRNCRGKGLGSQGRCQPTEERRTEQDSRDDFPYDSGLVEPAKECTEGARDDNNEDEGEQKVIRVPEVSENAVTAGLDGSGAPDATSEFPKNRMRKNTPMLTARVSA